MYCVYDVAARCFKPVPYIPRPLIILDPAPISAGTSTRSKSNHVRVFDNYVDASIVGLMSTPDPSLNPDLTREGNLLFYIHCFICCGFFIVFYLLFIGLFFV